MERDKVQLVRSFMDRRKFKKKGVIRQSYPYFKVGGNCEAMAGCKL